MNWEQTKIDLGLVREKQTIRFAYKAIKELDVVNFTPSCGGCTTIDGFKNSVLVVKYKGESIPTHILLEGKTTIDYIKTIRVTYRNGVEEVLTFVVKITK